MKRLFYLVVGLVLLPALLFAQIDYSPKALYNKFADYYTKAESDAKYATTTGDAYTKAESDGRYATTAEVAAKANSSDVYTIAQTDATIEAYVASHAPTDVYTKSETDATIEAYVAATVPTNVYTKTESDATLENYFASTIKAYINGTDETLVSGLATWTAQLVQTTANNVWFSQDSKVNGFVGQNATLTLTPSTLAFGVNGDAYWYEGVKTSISSLATLTLDDVAGMQYVYTDDNTPTLKKSTAPWNNDFENVAQIATVYNNPTHTGPISCILFDERHGVMDTRVHKYLHSTKGATSPNRFPLSAYSLQPASPSDGGNQFAVTGGTLYDEDIATVIGDHPDGAAPPILWREGASGHWTWNTDPVVPVLYGTYAKINEYTGGSWTTSEVAANRFFNMYVVVTNAYDDSIYGTFEIVLVPGQAAYTSLAAAEAEGPASLNLGDFPANECLFTNKITFRTSASYTSSGKCRIEAVESLAGINISLGAASVVTSHPSLGDRNIPNQHEDVAIAMTHSFAGTLTTPDLQTWADSIEAAVNAGGGGAAAALVEDTAITFASSLVVELHYVFDTTSVVVFKNGVMVPRRFLMWYDGLPPTMAINDPDHDLDLSDDEIIVIGYGSTISEHTATNVSANLFEFSTDIDTSSVVIYRNGVAQPRRLLRTNDVAGKTQVEFLTTVSSDDEIIATIQ